MFHKKLICVSDGNELELVEHNLKNKCLYYRYTKSLTKIDMNLVLSEQEYEKIIRQEIFKPIL